MERDFMGMIPKSSQLVVKQEPDDGSSNSEVMRESSLQWSFLKSSNTASQVLSFKAAQEQDGSHKLYPPGFSQRIFALDKQGGNQYPIVGHRRNHTDVFLASEVKPFSVTGQTRQTVPSASSSILPSHLTPSVLDSAVGGTSAVSTVSAVSPNCPVVGSTDLKSSPNIVSGPHQLTIFYSGSVCVYDNVPPEKAQAIMLLAGNGESTSSRTPATAVSSQPKVLSPMLRLPGKDANVPDQSKSFSSSISFLTPQRSLSAAALSGAADVNHVKPAVTAKCHESPKSSALVDTDAVKLIPSVHEVVDNGLVSSSPAVPQARKASLARFLEKRKERVTAASPYAVSKNGSHSFAANSSSSNPLPASN